VVEFVLVVAPILPLEAMIPCIIVYGLSAVLSAYYAYLAQAIDPMDEHLAKHLKRLENGDENNDGNGFGACLGNPGDTVEELKHCWICETQVSAQAMHCKFCNKCVGNFDHHCVCKLKMKETYALCFAGILLLSFGNTVLLTADFALWNPEILCPTIGLISHQNTLHYLSKSTEIMLPADNSNLVLLLQGLINA